MTGVQTCALPILDEYEIDCAMLDALENAKPCKNAPIEPVEEHATPSTQWSDAATAAESQTAASPAAPEGSSPTTELATAADAPGACQEVQAVKVAFQRVDEQILCRLLYVHDGLEHGAGAFLNELTHGVQIGGEGVLSHGRGCHRRQGGWSPTG